MIKAIPKDFKIPSNISYSQGEFIWDPEFKSDFDLAVYYAGKRPFPESKGQKKVLKWLNSLGLSFEEIKAHRKKIIDKLRQLTNAKGAGEKYPVVVIPPIPQSFKIDDKKGEEEDDSVLNDLDDLLNEIKSEEPESKKGDKKEDKTEEDKTEQPKSEESNNLSTDKKESEDLVEEEIDSRILEILGLTEVSDFTYGEYKTLLRERAAAGRMGSSDMSTETIELVTNEFKRVKNKEEGKFKIKPKTINISSVFNKKSPSPQKQQLDPKKLLPPGEEKKNADLGQQKESVEKQSGLDKVLTSILGTLNDIKSLLNDQLNADRLAAENLRKRQEISRKRRREDESESKQGKKDADVKSLTLPAFSFFDTIKRYFGNILAGSFVVGLLKWLTDPKNKKSVDNFKQFFINQGPLILGGILALALLPVASTLLGLTGAILGGIPKLIGALSFLSTPAGLAALATVVGVGAGIATVKGFADISRNIVTGGKKFREAQDRAAAKRQSAGVSRHGKVLERRGSRLIEGTKKRSPEQEKAYQEWLKETKRIDDIRDAMRAEIKTEVGKVKPSGIRSTGRTKGQKYFTEEDKEKQEKIKQRIREKYEAQLSGASQPLIQPQTPKTSDYVSPFAGARDREALKASKITGNAPITIGEKAGYSASRGRVHAGRDIAAPSGTGLQVPSDSVITDKGVDSGYGNYVVFKDSNGIEHLYGHMVEPSPYSKGDKVSAGTVIGRVGSTGRSSGPHLHWEVSRVMGEVGRPRQNIIDPIEMGFPAQAPFTGKVEASQLSPTTTPGTSITPGTPTFMAPFKMPQGAAGPSPIPSQGTSGAAGGSSSSPGQAKVPVFSSEDPNNVTTMVVKGIYNVVG